MKRLTRQTTFSLAVTSLVFAASAAWSAPVAVEFKLNPALKGREQVRAMNAITALGTVKVAKDGNGAFSIDAPSETDATRIAGSLRDMKHVLWAQPAFKAASVPQSQLAPRYHERMLAIDVKSGQDARAAVARIAASTGQALKLHRVATGNRAMVVLPVATTPASMAALKVAAESDAAISLVERVQILRHQWLPNDTLFSQQWALAEGIGGTRAGLAWDVTPSGSVNVGVIDTGIRRHPDLDGKFVSGYDMIRDGFIAVDGNGRDDDPSDPGDADIALDCSSPINAFSSWHGTHVAGIVAAHGNNGEGISGIAPSARIQSIRGLGRCGGTFEDIADSIRWAAGVPVPGTVTNPNPVRVMNLSLGGNGPCGANMQSAVDAAIARGVAVVVAAGNDEELATNFVPANCKGVITVGASNLLGNLSSYSNFGPELALLAPGGDFGTFPGVLSTLNGGGTDPAVPSYAAYSGTSMAAPHVAGVVALMFARDPSLTPGQVLNRLKASVRPFPPGTDCAGTTNVCGAGLLDAANAVASVPINRGVNEVAGSAARLHVVELVNSVNGRYTLSADPTEIARLTGNGWARTGQIFPTYSFTTNIGAGASIPQPVCRAKLYGHDAYRFSANTGECKDQVNANGMAADGVVFMAALPNANVCPSGSSAAWEMARFNVSENLYNFRTLTDWVEISAMTAAGWQYSRVAFCVPN